MSDRDAVPHLNLEVVADDEALAAAIQDLMSSADMREMVWDIAIYAMDLSFRLDPADWQVVLAAHQLESTFWRRAIAWAFGEGRRYPASDAAGAP